MKSDNEQYLLKDEKVLWEGKAEPFELLDKPYRNIFPVIWGVSVVIIAAFAGLYIPFFFRSGSTPGQFCMAFLCFVAPPLFVSLEPIFTKKTIEKNLSYVLTDKRALVINGKKVKAMVLEDNKEARIEKLSNGKDVLYIGKDACNSKTYSSRTNSVYAFHNPSKDPDVYTGVIFYSIPDAAQLCQKYLKTA